MIIRTGIDMVDVADMARRIEDGTLLRVFSAAEREVADDSGDRAAVYAAQWAAKEAYLKAAGTGIEHSWRPRLNEIEVLRDNEGRAYYRLSEFFRGLLPNGAETALSLSYTTNIATALTIISAPH